MKSFAYTITDEAGLHARPAGLLVHRAKAYDSEISVSKSGNAAKATKMMALMGLGIKKGDEITVTVTGSDEEKAAAELEEFFKTNL